MNLLSLFSGVGAFEKALDRLKIDYELVGFSEIDKYSVKSYCAIHGVDESMNLGDITKIDEKTLPKDIDLITYGFPCQDISLAGKQKGLFNEDGTQTRSGLFFEALRIIEETKPRVAIAENVKNLTSKKFNAQFQVVLESLEQAGYNNYWQVLNAKDYGIPQNRERVFIVSIRKDVDTGFFHFPEGFTLELRLKDMLEDVVDEKFYINDYKTITVDNDHQISLHGGKWDKLHESARRAYSEDYVSPTLPTCQGGNIERKVYFSCAMRGRYAEDGTVQQNIEISDREYSNAITTVQKDSMVAEPTINRVDIPQTVTVRKYPVDTDSLCETLRYHKSLVDQNNNGISNALNVPVTKVEHWFRKDDCFAIPDPDIWLKLKELLKIETDEFDESIMTFEEREGVFEKSERHYMSDGIAPTLTRTTASEKIIEPSLRIRKLTPKECFRLMDFDDSDFEKAEAVNSNTQLYKQAGNSIVVSVVYYILKALFEANILKKGVKQMELRIEPITFPEVIEFNFDELKQEITDKVAMYNNLVYTEEQVKEAKTDRAALNKFVKALSDERIKIKNQCLQPYEAFEKRINELSAIVNEPIALIDKQVKEFEEKKKQEKLDEITIYFNNAEHPEWLHLSQIMDEKWINASVSMKSVKEAIDSRLDQIEMDLTTLHDLPEFGFEATEVYKSTLNMNKALNEGHRLSEIAKKKAEHEAEQARKATEAEEITKMQSIKQEFAQAMNPPVEANAKQWVSFKALLTTEDALALKQFFKDRNIEFEAI